MYYQPNRGRLGLGQLKELQIESDVEPWLAPSFSCSLADGKLWIFVIQKLSMVLDICEKYITWVFQFYFLFLEFAELKLNGLFPNFVTVIITSHMAVSNM